MACLRNEPKFGNRLLTRAALFQGITRRSQFPVRGSRTGRVLGVKAVDFGTFDTCVGVLRNEPKFGSCGLGAFQFGFLGLALGFAALSSYLARCHMGCPPEK